MKKEKKSPMPEHRGWPSRRVPRFQTVSIAVFTIDDKQFNAASLLSYLDGGLARALCYLLIVSL